MAALEGRLALIASNAVDFSATSSIWHHQCPRAYAERGMMRMAWFARGDAHIAETPKVWELGQLVWALLFGAQPVVGPCLHEGWVAHKRAKDDDALLNIGLVTSPHLTAHFRNPKRSWAGFGRGHPGFAEMGCYATPVFDSAHGRV